MVGPCERLWGGFATTSPRGCCRARSGGPRRLSAVPSARIELERYPAVLYAERRRAALEAERRRWGFMGEWR